MTNPDGTPIGAGVEGSIGGVGLLLPGALGALGGIYDTYQSNKTARENTDKTIAAQRAEAEKAYQRSIQMWHMQNAYNTPEAQMRRFGAAGLNPHLIYGQGNAGNAQGTPQYQAPNLQYRYAAPTYGAAVGSVLPTLMAVGTWMQNMRLSEAELLSKRTNVEKAEQLIGYLSESNPRRLQELDNKLSMYPYQRSLQESLSQQASTKVNDMLQEYRYKWTDGAAETSGSRRLEFLKLLAESRLKTAQASWTDFNITNPQSIIQMVLGGVMSMAGQQMRFSTGGRINPKAKRVKTFYQDGKRRSQVVDY